ncbi:MAG: selenocysteine-specific translation factor, partial [Proteobacteria bacterium]
LAIARLAASGRVASTANGVRSTAHAGALAAGDAALAARIRRDAALAGLEPPNLKEWAERLGRRPETLRPLLAHLVREGALVAAPDDFWFDRDAVDALRARVVAQLERRGSLATPDYKAVIGTTRKHAVPLMELFDREKLTLRVGNARVLRSAGARRSS